MQRKFKQTTATVCLYATVLAFLTPAAGLAQSANSVGWERVLNLKPGDTVRIKEFGKRARTGKIEKVEASGITLSKRKSSLQLAKENIQRVGYFKNPKLDATAGWVALSGVGIATVAETVGTAQDLNQLSTGRINSSTGVHNVGLIIVGLGVAVTGLVIYFVGGRPQTIYEVK